MRTFYHVDRARFLTTGQSIELDDGLSAFGKAYWPRIAARPPVLPDDATRREQALETMRSERFNDRPGSRMTALFAALTVEDALLFARQISPQPCHPLPVFEVTADRAERYDSVWLDYVSEPDRMMEYYAAYWRGDITNHQPRHGPRRAPHFEILLQLPVQVGLQVATCLAPVTAPAP